MPDQDDKRVVKEESISPRLQEEMSKRNWGGGNRFSKPGSRKPEQTNEIMAAFCNRRNAPPPKLAKAITVSEAFTDQELRTILHCMAVALRHGRGAFRLVEKHCCKEAGEWIPVLRKVEKFLGIPSTLPAHEGDKEARR